MQKITYADRPYATEFGIGATLVLPSGPGAPDITPVPGYVFHVDKIRLMYFLWSREFHRADHELRAAIWAYGPTGSGKTSFFEQFFSVLGVPVISANANEESQVEDWLMTKALVDGSTIEIYGLLAGAMRAGVPFLVNEIQKLQPGQASMLNDIIERGIAIIPSTGETIRAERGFMVIGTANDNGAGDETGAYIGSNLQDRATMARFWMLQFEPPTLDQIRAQLAATVPAFASGGNAWLLDKAVELYAATVAMANGTTEGIRLSTPLNPRELVAFVTAMLFYAPYAQRGVKVTKTAIDLSFAGKYDSSTRAMLIEFTEGLFGETGVPRQAAQASP